MPLNTPARPPATTKNNPHHTTPHNAKNKNTKTKQVETKAEYDKVIGETEAAYLKILESSQTLLTVLKRESVNIQKKRSAAA